MKKNTFYVQLLKGNFILMASGDNVPISGSEGFAKNCLFIVIKKYTRKNKKYWINIGTGKKSNFKKSK